jgi:hypothetical protein
MILIALVLMAVGLATSLFGYKLFRLLLPLVGLVSGVLVGFTGFQGVYGKGAVSTTVAVFVALTVGIVMALLSFAYFSIALTVLSGIVGAAAATYLGLALGLGGQGFVMFLLALAGFVVGLVASGSAGFSLRFVMTLTSLAGVAFILAGIFLIAGHVSLDELHRQGVIASVLDVVDQSFIWLLVWIGGSMIAMNAQARTALLQLMNNQYAYKEPRGKK